MRNVVQILCSKYDNSDSEAMTRIGTKEGPETPGFYINNFKEWIEFVEIGLNGSRQMLTNDTLTFHARDF